MLSSQLVTPPTTVMLVSAVHIWRVFAHLITRTLWGNGFGECTTCRATGDPAWTCPAALSTFVDIGGSGGDIVELDGEPGKRQEHNVNKYTLYFRH